MTPKEKALELYNKFYLAIPSDEMGLTDEAARQCALLAVNFAKGCIRWNLYPVDAEWRELKEIEQELKNL